MVGVSLLGLLLLGLAASEAKLSEDIRARLAPTTTPTSAADDDAALPHERGAVASAGTDGSEKVGNGMGHGEASGNELEADLMDALGDHPHDEAPQATGLPSTADVLAMMRPSVCTPTNEPEAVWRLKKDFCFGVLDFILHNSPRAAGTRGLAVDSFDIHQLLELLAEGTSSAERKAMQARIEGSLAHDAHGRVATDDLLEWWFAQPAFTSSTQYVDALRMGVNDATVEKNAAVEAKETAAEQSEAAVEKEAAVVQYAVAENDTPTDATLKGKNDAGESELAGKTAGLAAEEAKAKEKAAQDMAEEEASAAAQARAAAEAKAAAVAADAAQAKASSAMALAAEAVNAVGEMKETVATTLLANAGGAGAMEKGRIAAHVEVEVEGGSSQAAGKEMSEKLKEATDFFREVERLRNGMQRGELADKNGATVSGRAPADGQLEAAEQEGAADTSRKEPAVMGGSASSSGRGGVGEDVLEVAEAMSEQVVSERGSEDDGTEQKEERNVESLSEANGEDEVPPEAEHTTKSVVHGEETAKPLQAEEEPLEESERIATEKEQTAEVSEEVEHTGEQKEANVVHDSPAEVMAIVMNEPAGERLFEVEKGTAVEPVEERVLKLAGFETGTPDLAKPTWEPTMIGVAVTEKSNLTATLGEVEKQDSDVEQVEVGKQLKMVDVVKSNESDEGVVHMKMEREEATEKKEALEGSEAGKQMDEMTKEDEVIMVAMRETPETLEIGMKNENEAVGAMHVEVGGTTENNASSKSEGAAIELHEIEDDEKKEQRNDLEEKDAIGVKKGNGEEEKENEYEMQDKKEEKNMLLKKGEEEPSTEKGALMGDSLHEARSDGPSDESELAVESKATPAADENVKPEESHATSAMSTEISVKHNSTSKLKEDYAEENPQTAHGETVKASGEESTGAVAVETAEGGEATHVVEGGLKGHPEMNAKEASGMASSSDKSWKGGKEAAEGASAGGSAATDVVAEDSTSTHVSQAESEEPATDNKTQADQSDEGQGVEKEGEETLEMVAISVSGASEPLSSDAAGSSEEHAGINSKHEATENNHDKEVTSVGSAGRGTDKISSAGDGAVEHSVEAGLDRASSGAAGDKGDVSAPGGVAVEGAGGAQARRLVGDAFRRHAASLAPLGGRALLAVGGFLVLCSYSDLQLALAAAIARSLVAPGAPDDSSDKERTPFARPAQCEPLARPAALLSPPTRCSPICHYLQHAAGVVWDLAVVAVDDNERLAARLAAMAEVFVLLLSLRFFVASTTAPSQRRRRFMTLIVLVLVAGIARDQLDSSAHTCAVGQALLPLLTVLCLAFFSRGSLTMTSLLFGVILSIEPMLLLLVPLVCCHLVGKAGVRRAPLLLCSLVIPPILSAMPFLRGSESTLAALLSLVRDSLPALQPTMALHTSHATLNGSVWAMYDLLAPFFGAPALALQLEDTSVPWFLPWPAHRTAGGAVVLLLMVMPLYRGATQSHPSRLLAALVFYGTALLLFFPECANTVQRLLSLPLCLLATETRGLARVGLLFFYASALQFVRRTASSSPSTVNFIMTHLLAQLLLSLISHVCLNAYLGGVAVASPHSGRNLLRATEPDPPEGIKWRSLFPSFWRLPLALIALHAFSVLCPQPSHELESRAIALVREWLDVLHPLLTLLLSLFVVGFSHKAGFAEGKLLTDAARLDSARSAADTARGSSHEDAREREEERAQRMRALEDALNRAKQQIVELQEQKQSAPRVDDDTQVEALKAQLAAVEAQEAMAQAQLAMAREDARRANAVAEEATAAAQAAATAAATMQYDSSQYEQARYYDNYAQAQYEDPSQYSVAQAPGEEQVGSEHGQGFASSEEQVGYEHGQNFASGEELIGYEDEQSFAAGEEQIGYEYGQDFAAGEEQLGYEQAQGFAGGEEQVGYEQAQGFAGGEEQVGYDQGHGFTAGEEQLVYEHAPGFAGEDQMWYEQGEIAATSVEQLGYQQGQDVAPSGEEQVGYEQEQGFVTGEEQAWYQQGQGVAVGEDQAGYEPGETFAAGEEQLGYEQGQGFPAGEEQAGYEQRQAFAAGEGQVGYDQGQDFVTGEELGYDQVHREAPLASEISDHSQWSGDRSQWSGDRSQDYSEYNQWSHNSAERSDDLYGKHPAPASSEAYFGQPMNLANVGAHPSSQHASECLMTPPRRCQQTTPECWPNTPIGGAAATTSITGIRPRPTGPEVLHRPPTAHVSTPLGSGSCNSGPPKDEQLSRIHQLGTPFAHATSVDGRAVDHATETNPALDDRPSTPRRQVLNPVVQFDANGRTVSPRRSPRASQRRAYPDAPAFS